MGNSLIHPPERLKSKNIPPKKYKKSISQSSEMRILLGYYSHEIVEISSMMAFFLGYSNRRKLISMNCMDLVPKTQPKTGIETKSLIDSTFLKAAGNPEHKAEMRINCKRERDSELMNVQMEIVKLKSDYYVEILAKEPDIDVLYFEKMKAGTEKPALIDTEEVIKALSRDGSVNTVSEADIEYQEGYLDEEEANFAKCVDNLGVLTKNLDYEVSKRAMKLLEDMNALFMQAAATAQKAAEAEELRKHIEKESPAELSQKLGTLLSQLEQWEEKRAALSEKYKSELEQ